MLKDSVRTETYRRAIVNNKHLFKDKIVLDLGCGTGILSMFAAQAGASKVIGVDCAGIALQAQAIVKANGFGEIITILHGKIEELDLPVKKVDIIISEWMGYFLLYESMLDSVIYARDKYLVEGGLLFPDQANLYIHSIEDGEYRDDKITFWENVYGFDMSVIKEMALLEPLVDVVPKDAVNSSLTRILHLDLQTVGLEDCDFKTDFELTINRTDYVHALVVHFDVVFSHSHKPLVISTGCLDKYTHWKQTVFYLEDELAVHRDDVLAGTIRVNRNARNPRDLDIFLGVVVKNETEKTPEETGKMYRLR